MIETNQPFTDEQRSIQRQYVRGVYREPREHAARLIRAALAIKAADRDRRKGKRKRKDDALDRRRLALHDLTFAIIYACADRVYSPRLTEKGFSETQVQTIVRRVLPEYRFHVSKRLLGKA